MFIPLSVQAFLLYFITGSVMLTLFCGIYLRLTAHDEIALIRQGNLAAAIALGGSLAGFAIPLSRSIAQASSIPDLMIWSGLALVVQIAVYGLARWLVPKLSDRIGAGDIAPALFVATLSVIAGMLNSASMSL